MSEHLREDVYIPYLDGRLSDAERAELDRHLAACADCRARLEELGAVLGVVGEWKGVEPSPGFDAALRARLAEEPAAARPWYAVRLAHALALATAVVLALGVYLWPPEVTPPQGFPPWVAPPPPPVTPTAPPVVETPRLPAGQANDEVAGLENPVLLENYELLEEFDVLFEPLPTERKTL